MQEWRFQKEKRARGDSNAFPQGQSNQSKPRHLKIHTNYTGKKLFHFFLHYCHQKLRKGQRCNHSCTSAWLCTPTCRIKQMNWIKHKRKEVTRLELHLWEQSESIREFHQKGRSSEPHRKRIHQYEVPCTLSLSKIRFVSCFPPTVTLKNPRDQSSNVGIQFPAVNSHLGGSQLPVVVIRRGPSLRHTGLHPGRSNSSRKDAELPPSSAWDSEMLLQKSLFSENFTAKCEWISAIHTSQRQEWKTDLLWNNSS